MEINQNIIDIRALIACREYILICSGVDKFQRGVFQFCLFVLFCTLACRRNFVRTERLKVANSLRQKVVWSRGES